MSQLESRKEYALRHLYETTIPLIVLTSPPTTYYLTVNRISRKFLVPDELDNADYPCVCIIDDGQTSYTPLTANTYTTGTPQDITSGCPIFLIGYVMLEDEGKEGDAGGLSTLMNKLHRDMIVAMHTDTTLGNYVLHTSLSSSATSTVFSAEKRIGTVIQQYEIKYDFEPQHASTPTT
jgi:hypothetical protein